MKYLLCTNIWNEREHIEKTFQMVNEFTLRPKKWLWIVDGSTDGSEYEIERCAGLYDLNVQCFILPPKEKGNLRTLGKAYNAAFDALGIRNEDYDFMSVIDVDNWFHPEYMEIMSCLFAFDVGAASGYNSYSPKLKMPQGNGKLVRWDVVKSIDEFWNPAIDTMLNIKAAAMGYEWVVMYGPKLEIKGPPATRNTTTSGSRHAGWLWYYASGSFKGAIARMFYRIFKRRYGMSFMRGFLEGRKLGEQSEDPDVKKFYGRK